MKRLTNNKGAIETMIIMIAIATGLIAVDFVKGNGWEPVTGGPANGVNISSEQASAHWRP
jgi:hypothetical protein